MCLPVSRSSNKSSEVVLKLLNSSLEVMVVMIDSPVLYAGKIPSNVEVSAAA